MTPDLSFLSPSLGHQLLTHKWHSLLVLTTCAYQVLRGDDQFASTNCDTNNALEENDDHQLQQQTEHNMNTLIRCLGKFLFRQSTSLVY